MEKSCIARLKPPVYATIDELENLLLNLQTASPSQLSEVLGNADSHAASIAFTRSSYPQLHSKLMGALLCFRSLNSPERELAKAVFDSVRAYEKILEEEPRPTSPKGHERLLIKKPARTNRPFRILSFRPSRVSKAPRPPEKVFLRPDELQPAAIRSGAHFLKVCRYLADRASLESSKHIIGNLELSLDQGHLHLYSVTVQDYLDILLALEAAMLHPSSFVRPLVDGLVEKMAQKHVLENLFGETTLNYLETQKAERELRQKVHVRWVLE